MVKVYECGFTSSGINQTDSIGNVNITLGGSSIYQDPLNGFNNRPGWFIDAPSTIPTDNNNVLYFRDTSRPKKTVILWFRITSGDGSGNLMSGGSTFSRDGLYGVGGRLRFVWNGNNWATLFGIGEYDNNEWHMAVVQSDYVNNETVFYSDGVYNSTYSSYLPDNNTMELGEPNCELGLLQVYDTILNSAEISNLWNTGLIDAPIQQPILTLEGKVYDFNNTEISGADVRVFNHSNKEIESSYVTSSGGDYIAYFPTVGDYSISVSKREAIGGRSIPITVTSGGYTTYDN